MRVSETFNYCIVIMFAISHCDRKECTKSFKVEGLNEVKSKAELGKIKTMPFCGACKYMHYCSKECQVADWEARHRAECKNYKSPLRHKVILQNLFLHGLPRGVYDCNYIVMNPEETPNSVNRIEHLLTMSSSIPPEFDKVKFQPSIFINSRKFWIFIPEDLIGQYLEPSFKE